MSDRPLPPFLPEDGGAFASHILGNTDQWYEYFCQAYDYVSQKVSEDAEVYARIDQQNTEILRLQEESTKLRESLAAAQAIQGYQKKELDEARDQLVSMKAETQLRERIPDTKTTAYRPDTTAPETSTPPDSRSTTSNQLSERLPDPDKFNGDRKDLRRFISQIHGKLKTNRDRFPTAQSRTTYVTNRLSGPAYAQILPHVKEGVCQLKDYEQILEALNRAFGDPNLVNNARNDLFRLRQANKDFSTFFAEFQRLALEGEMSEDSLPTLLEQAISRELRAMLLHHDPPSREYHQYAAFLQDLENRRLRFHQTPALAPKQPFSYAAAATPRQSVTASPDQSKRDWRAPRPASPVITGGDPMDLSSQRRFAPGGRKERGECFRCGSKDHRVAACPEPDTRPSSQLRQFRASYIHSPDSARSVSPPLSPPGSTNGMSLG